ncbi:MAG: hypothetical protein ABGW87_07665 [Sphingomonadaceae bacterium]
MRLFVALLSAASLAVVPVAASAAPCKDAKGKFIKCPPTPAAKAVKKTTTKTEVKKTTKSSGKKTGRCRNAKGQFAKCGTPGAHPA